MEMEKISRFASIDFFSPRARGEEVLRQKALLAIKMDRRDT